MLEHFLVFTAAAATDFALVRWQVAAQSGRLWAAPVWSIAVAGLGLIGLAGALTGPAGVFAYLAGNAGGSFVAAYLSQRTPT